MTEEEALEVLRENGYTFPPLWKNMPPLQPSTLDLSIIIPVYNDEKFLPRLLDAILNQKTEYHYEVICINDGSTDASQEMLDSYKSKYSSLLTVVHQDNSGISITRNRGITLAKGEYVGFIDDDDIVEADYIETIMHRAKATDADMVQTAFSAVTPDEKILSVKKKPDIDFSPASDVTAYESVAGFIWGGIAEILIQACTFPGRLLVRGYDYKACNDAFGKANFTMQQGGISQVPAPDKC